MTNTITQPGTTPIYDEVAKELGVQPSELAVPARELDEQLDGHDESIPLAS